MQPLPHMTAKELQELSGPDVADIHPYFFEYVVHFMNNNIDAINDNLRWYGLVEPNEHTRPMTREQLTEYSATIAESWKRARAQQAPLVCFDAERSSS